MGPVGYYGLGSDFIYTKNLQGVVSEDHDDLIARGPSRWFTQVNYPVGPVRYYGLGSDFIYTKNLQRVVSYDHDDLIASPNSGRLRLDSRKIR